MPPRLYVFRFNIAIYLAAYPYRAILTIYFNYYTTELLPLRQALLKKEKLTYPNLLIFKHYRVSGQELIIFLYLFILYRETSKRKNTRIVENQLAAKQK